LFLDQRITTLVKESALEQVALKCFLSACIHAYDSSASFSIAKRYEKTLSSKTFEITQQMMIS
jgi:hypothetical protein